jgi:peroxiredoxin
MARRWKSRSIVLAAVAVVMILCGVDLGRSYLAGVTEERFRAAHGDVTPPFKQGDLAPDFTLPDSAGKKHSLSSLVHRDTMLCLLCGCDQCRQAQAYLGQLLRKMGDRAPQVISVSSAPPEGEAAWKRETRLEQTLLYDSKAIRTPIIELYRGHPCPRLYRLSADRRVTWIGPSPVEGRDMLAFGAAMERNLGVTADYRPASPR